MLTLQKVKCDESISMTDREHLDTIFTPPGIKKMLLECLPVSRTDGVEGKLAASSQMNKLKHLDEVLNLHRFFPVLTTGFLQEYLVLYRLWLFITDRLWLFWCFSCHIVLVFVT